MAEKSRKANDPPRGRRPSSRPRATRRSSPNSRSGSTAQLRAALAVNRELIELYWRIGRDILARQKDHGWGAKVIDRLSEDLRRAFPGVEGFSPRNLKYMRAFARGLARASQLCKQAACTNPLVPQPARSSTR